MASTFRIGKTGPTILQGTAVPDPASGANGDLYVQIGGQPKLYVKQTLGWTVSSDPVFGYVRQAVTTGGTTVIDPQTSYIAVNAQANTTVQLANGSTSKTVICKDEGGSAGSYPITLIGASGDTLDGQPSWTIDLDYGGLTLIYGETGWHLISITTSSLFNQLRL